MGALLLFVRWLPEMGAGRAAYAAVFHAVSAFCNAGFALWPDSLTAWRGDAWVVLTVSALVVLGGLGFFKVYEIVRSRRTGLRLSVHSKLALAVSAVLIVAGAAVFWLLESYRALSGMGPGCAGGVKTTTLGVLAVAALTRLRGRVHVNVFGRTLGPGTVRNTLTIALGGAAGVLPALFALLVLQAPGGTVEQERSLFMDYLFETVSALATVGLSTGITGDLTPASRRPRACWCRC